ncbi:MAG TPA: saccharopine dehydrogenase NADP-binding domain-containing protein [Thermoanaerobaculia bacterium]|nr:saccharopine dehydrogenase NADP-binding domain-containing protein [Thermoanaerobaculia bacterium]
MWMIYGANGYTGELIAREAARRGERPILAGRDRAAVEALAKELGLESRVFPLDAPDLRGVSLVLHCAGPFLYTSAPMVRACLDAGAHYLDITGEIAVFEAVMRKDGEAKQRGVTLLPGVGFDVVPTDCLAAQLAKRLPDADELWLAFDTSGGGLSRGTRRTMIEGLDKGGAIRRDGKIINVPQLYDVRPIPFAHGERMAITIPWGDVSTAYHTTGIPNIRVYNATSPKTIKRMRRMLPLLPLLRFKPLKRWLVRRVKPGGPDATTRATSRIHLWGRAAHLDGTEVTMTMEVAEGYAFTVLSALAAVKRVLAEPVQAGSFTPAKRFGERFVNEVSS